MALQNFGPAWTPAPEEGTAGLPAFSTIATLTANTHRYAAIYQVPKTGSIHKAGFKLGTCTTNATSRMQLKIETVSAVNGDPTGSAYGGMVLGVSGVQPTTGLYDLITLGTDATATAGDLIAVCYDFNTFTAADSVIVQGVNGSTGTSITFPYSDVFTASWTKNTGTYPSVCLEYSDGSYAFISGSAPYTAITNTAFNSGTAVTDEYALSATVKVPCRLAGGGVLLAQAGDCEIDLYVNGATTATVAVSLDKDQIGTTAQRFRTFVFPGGQTIAANQKFYVSVRPTTVTNVTLQIYTVNTASVLDQLEGGQNYCLGTRVDQGAWAADTTTQKPAIYLYFDQFDNGVSAGGVKVHPGMDGGING